MKVKAPFAGHPAASSAWLPAATLSLPGSPESHCNRDTATTTQIRLLCFLRNLRKTSRNAFISYSQLFSFLIVDISSRKEGIDAWRTLTQRQKQRIRHAGHAPAMLFLLGSICYLKQIEPRLSRGYKSRCGIRGCVS